MNSPSVPRLTPKYNSILHAERRKEDLIALADFGARTGRRWLVRDALLAMRREGLMAPTLAHLVPRAVLDDPAPFLAETLRADGVWVVAEPFDALRLESYGFPALAIGDRLGLTPDDLGGCRWVILLQRPGEESTLAGLDVRAELLRLGWVGTLTAIVLPFADLDDAEAECGPEAFGAFLAGLIPLAMSQSLAGDYHNASKRCSHEEEPSVGPLYAYRGYRGYRPYRGYGREVTHG